MKIVKVKYPGNACLVLRYARTSGYVLVNGKPNKYISLHWREDREAK